jgi:hypothetical protein
MPLLTPEFIHHILVVAFLLSVFYFLLKPKKQSQQPVNNVDANTACTNDYHAVKLRIQHCDTIGMCAKVDQDIEVFYDSYYETADKDLVDNYYVNLLTQLTDIKLRLRDKEISTT